MKHLSSKGLATIIVFTLFMASCQKSEVIPPSELAEVSENLRYSKELTVTDKSGRNSIVLEVSTNNEAFLERYTKNTFTLKALFALPAPSSTSANISHDYDEEEANDWNSSAMITIKSKQLEKGAVAYQLIRQEHIPNFNRSCATNYDVYIFTDNYVDFGVTSGSNGRAKIGYSTWLKPNTWKNLLNACLDAGDTYNNIGKTSHRIRFRIDNGLNYWFSTHN